MAARIAASAVTRSPGSDRASPTSPAATSRPARAAARPGWGRLEASITCGKLARDGTYGAPPTVVSIHGVGAVEVERLVGCPPRPVGPSGRLASEAARRPPAYVQVLPWNMGGRGSRVRRRKRAVGREISDR